MWSRWHPVSPLHEYARQVDDHHADSSLKLLPLFSLHPAPSRSGSKLKMRLSQMMYMIPSARARSHRAPPLVSTMSQRKSSRTRARSASSVASRSRAPALPKSTARPSQCSLGPPLQVDPLHAREIPEFPMPGIPLDMMFSRATVPGLGSLSSGCPLS